MNQPEAPHLDVCPEPCLEKAIADLMKAQCEYKNQASVESEYRYNETYLVLGAA